MPLLVLFLVLFFPVIVSSEGELNFVVCSSDLYPSGSPFESALRRLLDNLTALPPKSPFLYSDFSSSLISGFAQCRPDASRVSCADCLLASYSKLSNAANGGCGRSISAVSYQDLCIFRYSNANISASLDESLVGYAISVQKASAPANFSRRVAELMGRISWDASMSPARFAAGVAETGDPQKQKIYGMVWCKLDLMTYDCFRCLLSAVGKLPFTRVGGRIYEMSCLVRFEVYTFVDPSFIKSPTSPEFLATGVGKENSTTTGGGPVWGVFTHGRRGQFKWSASAWWLADMVKHSRACATVWVAFVSPPLPPCRRPNGAPNTALGVYVNCGVPLRAA